MRKIFGLLPLVIGLTACGDAAQTSETKEVITGAEQKQLRAASANDDMLGELRNVEVLQITAQKTDDMPVKRQFEDTTPYAELQIRTQDPYVRVVRASVANGVISWVGNKAGQAWDTVYNTIMGYFNSGEETKMLYIFGPDLPLRSGDFVKTVRLCSTYRENFAEWGRWWSTSHEALQIVTMEYYTKNVEGRWEVRTYQPKDAMKSCVQASPRATE